MRLILAKLVRIVPNLVRIELFPQFVCEIIQKKISRVFQIQVSTRIIRVGYLGQTMDLFRIEITQSYPYGQSSCNQPSHSFCAHIFPLVSFFLSLSLFFVSVLSVGLAHSCHRQKPEKLLPPTLLPKQKDFIIHNKSQQEENDKSPFVSEHMLQPPRSCIFARSLL